MEFEGHTLKRIRYLRSLHIFVQKGSLGGWIESEENLSHEGHCYVINEAKVFGHARIVDNAVVTGASIVKDNVLLLNETQVRSRSVLGGDTIVSGQTYIFGHSKIAFYSHVADEYYGGVLVRPNISNSTIEKCTIQATGEIINSDLRNEELYGMLDY